MCILFEWRENFIRANRYGLFEYRNRKRVRQNKLNCQKRCIETALLVIMTCFSIDSKNKKILGAKFQIFTTHIDINRRISMNKIIIVRKYFIFVYIIKLQFYYKHQ